MHTELVVAKAVTSFTTSSQAYRGARRHASRPMLFVAAGFVLISVGALLESVLIDLAGWSVLRAGFLQSSLVAAGMVSVLYGLYGGDVA